jgi:hypothetical protein
VRPGAALRALCQENALAGAAGGSAGHLGTRGESVSRQFPNPLLGKQCYTQAFDGKRENISNPLDRLLFVA